MATTTTAAEQVQNEFKALESKARQLCAALATLNVDWLKYNAKGEMTGNLRIEFSLEALFAALDDVASDGAEEMIDLDITTPVSLS